LASNTTTRLKTLRNVLKSVGKGPQSRGAREDPRPHPVNSKQFCILQRFGDNQMLSECESHKRQTQCASPNL
jgi:hypothetical protein